MTSRQGELAAEMARTVTHLKSRALAGFFSGTGTEADQRYLDSCRTDSFATSTRLIFTRDIGYHSCGWWKNPDYERCWHLSLSALPSPGVIVAKELAELDGKTTELWVQAFFGEHVTKAWCEPPYSAIGKQLGVHHWRLFCDENWVPLLPRGEVYGTQFTELGWKSASQVIAERKAREAGILLPK